MENNALNIGDKGNQKKMKLLKQQFLPNSLQLKLFYVSFTNFDNKFKTVLF